MPSKSTYGWPALFQMRKLLNKPWFVAVIALGAFLLVGNSVLSVGQGTAPRGPAPLEAAAGPVDEPSAVAAPRLAAREALRVLPVPAALLDPFALRQRSEDAVVAEKAAAPDFVEHLHLSAIWTQDRTTLVLINDRICQAGDEFGRLKIESATQAGVWVTHWKGRDFLLLGGDFTLRTPAKNARAAGSTL